MFKRILSFVAALAIASSAIAADTKISAYGSMSALGGTELLLGDQSGVTKTTTPAQIATYVSGNLSSIALASLAAQATNTIVANVTSGSASPTAVAVSSCSSSSSALTWTTNTGPTCNTSINAATLGGATFAAPGTIGGTTRGVASFTTLNSTVFAFAAGTSFSGASWLTVSPVFNGTAMTLNDTTASGTVTDDVGYSLQAVNFTSTGGASTTITTAAGLYIPAPTCTTVICTAKYSIWTGGGILASGVLQAQGGLTIVGATASINNSSNFAVNIGSGTNNATTTIGGTTAGNIVNLASVSTKVGGVLYASVTAPTITSGFNTSSQSITAASTAAFQVTVGSGTGTTTGVLAMPTATTGWACEATDVTTATNAVQQTGSTTASVTVTNYVRTTGVAGNFANGDKINFICGAF